MKKAELKKRMSEITCKIFMARTEAEDLLEELEEDQGRISDDDVDVINHFVSDCETAEENERNL